MRTPLYPKILVEGRYAPRNDTNNLYDSLIDAPDSIDHPDIRWDPLDRCRCLHRIKCNVSGGAKIERSGGTVPQLTKTGIRYYKLNNCTYGHRLKNNRHPVRSAKDKLQIDQLVVGWVTTSEYWLLYIQFLFCIWCG